jgi:hypothetical protein
VFFKPLLKCPVIEAFKNHTSRNKNASFMKPQKLSSALLAILAISLTFTACKKDNTSASDTNQVQSDDDVAVSNETDAAANDANATIENNGGTYAGRPTFNVPAIPPPCDATITADTVDVPRTITITYNGSNCSNTRNRTGKVILSFAPGFHWADAGAAMTITYDSLTITRHSDNKSIIINGSETFTNVTGGLLKDLSGTDSIVHTITSSGLSVTFNDGLQRNWQVSKRRVFTYNSGIVVSTTGTGAGGTAEWGTNRYGSSFTSAIITPIVIEQSCEMRVVSGETLYTGPIATIATTYGLDANGNVLNSCPTGYFYYKMVWTINNKSYTFIGPY